MMDLKTLLLLSGAVLTVVGLAMKNWQIAVVGNSLALAGIIFA